MGDDYPNRSAKKSVDVASVSQVLRYLLLGLTYVGLGLGYIPGLRMNRATIALVGSALLIGLGALSLREAWNAIDATTVVFLLGIMIVNANLASSGFFQVAMTVLLRLSRSPLGVLTLLTLGTGILSAFFLNDTIALVFTPLVLELAQALSLNPIPYLLALAAATNTGSVATLSGNPQNILIGSFSGISYLEFMGALTPIALVGLILQIGLLYLLYPQVRSIQPTQGAYLPKPRIYRPLLIKSVMVTTGLLLAFVAGFPLAESALIAASLLLITRRIKPHRVLQRVDWNLLVLFSGLFILTRITQELDLLSLVSGFTHSSLGLLGVTTLLSNLISNVPAVLLLESLIPPDNTQAWLLLAAGSTLAGNLTLFGSVANLITAEAANQLGYRLTFGEHFRFGLPLTLATLILAYIWILG